MRTTRRCIATLGRWVWLGMVLLAVAAPAGAGDGLASDDPAVRDKALQESLAERQAVRDGILRALREAVETHRADRRYGSPLASAIGTAAICHVVEAEPLFLKTIDYEIDGRSLPVGINVKGDFFFPSASALASLRVDPLVMAAALAGEDDARRRHLLTWVLVRRTGGEAEARRFMDRLSKHPLFASPAARQRHERVMKLLAGEVRLPAFTPVEGGPSRRWPRDAEHHRRNKAWIKEHLETVDRLAGQLRDVARPSAPAYHSPCHCLVLALGARRPIGHYNAEEILTETVACEIDPETIPPGVTLSATDRFPAAKALADARPAARDLIRPIVKADDEKTARLLCWVLLKTAGSAEDAKAAFAAEKGYYFSGNEKIEHYHRVMAWLDLPAEKLLPTPREPTSRPTTTDGEPPSPH